jgi:hypothetical protein
MSRLVIPIDALRKDAISTKTVAEVPPELSRRHVWATDRWFTGSADNLD